MLFWEAVFVALMWFMAAAFAICVACFVVVALIAWKERKRK